MTNELLRASAQRFLHRIDQIPSQLLDQHDLGLRGAEALTTELIRFIAATSVSYPNAGTHRCGWRNPLGDCHGDILARSRRDRDGLARRTARQDG
jgi:hypothetical protein